MKFRYFLFPALGIISQIISAQTTVLSRFLDAPELKYASASVFVTDIASEKTIIAHDQHKALAPASVQKLVVTATAIETLGADYRYTTTVALDAADPSRILIIGAGDPTLGSEAFDDDRNAFFANCATALKNALPAERKYSIYVVDNLFGYMGVSPEWTWEDMGNYYAAGAYGISVFDNTYRLTFNTTGSNACPRIMRMEPQVAGLTFENYLSLNSTGKDNGFIYGMPFSNRRSIRGDIPSGRREFVLKGDIPDPGMMVGETLADYLQRAGIEIESVTTAREDYISQLCNSTKTPSYRQGTTLYEHRSRPMSDIIRAINVESNNHYTEHLVRTLGRLNNSDIYSDALDEGIAFVQRFWKSKGIDTGSLMMHDGCGLAPQNAVNGQCLTDILTYMYGSKNAKTFRNSLAVAGVSGTLRSFMAGTPYKGKIAAKSGSIGGVLCYAGYVSDGDMELTFVVMVNKFNGTHREVRQVIERLLSGVFASAK